MSWVYLRKYKTIDEDLQAFEKVNMRQIQQVLERYPLMRVTTTALGPLSKLKKPETPTPKK